ncbi:MAG: hypothetical protein ACJAT4_000346 [Granulosicoccus sp.]|jgi:hypothetical protein
MDDISRNIDQQLREAYLATTYEVKYLGLQLRIGEENWDLEEFLIDNNAFSWAFISAWNPFSKPLPLSENEIRHARLKNLTKSKQWVFAEGFGIPQNKDWEAEKSLFILDISKTDAINLGKNFDQNAIVIGRLGKAPELLFL